MIPKSSDVHPLKRILFSLASGEAGGWDKRWLVMQAYSSGKSRCNSGKGLCQFISLSQRHSPGVGFPHRFIVQSSSSPPLGGQPGEAEIVVMSVS